MKGKRDKILIGIPTRGNIVSGLAIYLFNLHNEVTVLMSEDKWLSEARNGIFQYGLKHKEFSHMLFCDSDTYPTPGSKILDNMLSLNKDIVCAPIFLHPAINPKTGEFSSRIVEFVLNNGQYEARNLENPLKTHKVSGWLPIAFSLINLTAFRDINEKYWFGMDLSIWEDKTFAEKALRYGKEFWHISEKVNHRVDGVVI